MTLDAQNDTDDRPQGRADADDSPDPPGSKRHRPLDTLERVRRELSRVYFDQKDGRLDMETAKGRAYLLSQITAVLKAETASDGEVTALLAQVRDKLKDRPR